MEKKLLKYIEESERIFITSHISPDADAITSVLLLGRTLCTNYPAKHISMFLEEEPAKDLQILNGYENIIFGSILNEAASLKPDLFIMLDVANFNRISRAEGPKIRSSLNDNGARTVIIDHHEKTGSDAADLYINEQLPATVQQVYQMLFEALKLKKPDGYAETTLLGILADTNRFKYQNPAHHQTFSVVSELLDAGASIEKLETQTERYDKDSLGVLAEFLRNTVSQNNYTYSYLDDDFIDKWQAVSKDFSAIKEGSDLFTNNYLRNVGENQWGFAVYREYPSGDNIYSARFRAIEGSGDMSKLAAKLGGGGHKGAAGAKFEATNVGDAIMKVKSAIGEAA